jgi:RHS repeat-associated protein
VVVGSHSKPRGRLARETNALEKTRTYAYDGASNLVERVDRNGRIISYEYDKANRNIYEKWYDDVTLERTIGFTYSAAGYLSQATDPSGTYNYEYDALGRVTEEEQDIEGLTPVVKYASVYDGPNRLDYIQSEIGGTDDFKNTYGYDAWGRISSLIQQGGGGNTVAGKRADFTYNAANQFEKISRYEGTGTSELAINTFYDYDLAGRLKTLLHTMDGTLPGSGWGTGIKAGYLFYYETIYDPSGNITGIQSYHDGWKSFGYDGQNQLTWDGPQAINYDDNGNRSAWSTGTNNQLLSDGSFYYEYDDEGNRVRKIDIVSEEVTEYAYDHRNRLVSVERWSPEVEPAEGWGGYDVWGSDTSYTYHLRGMSGSAPEGDNLLISFVVFSGGVSIVANVEYWTEDVTAEEGEDDYTPLYSSTSPGVLSTITGYFNVATLADSLNETTESFAVHLRIQGYPESEIVLEGDIEDEDGAALLSEVDYTYDVFNQLIRRIADADGEFSAPATDTFYSQLNGQIALQFEGDDASDLSHRYFWGPIVDQLLADEQVSSLGSAGSYLWPLADQVGTIRDLATHNPSTDETTVDNHRVYDAFGNLLSETNDAVDEVFGFTGRLWDEATQTQNNLHRIYDPATGRFLTEDPIGFGGGDANLSRYVGNSPTSFTDPQGLQTKPLQPGESVPENYSPKGPSDLPDFLKGKWEVSICASEGHAWIRFKNVDTGEVHTTGRYKNGYGGRTNVNGEIVVTPVVHPGVQLDKDLTKEEGLARGIFQKRSVIVINPKIFKGKSQFGFGEWGNNCATYARDAWYDYSGEFVYMPGYDSPVTLLNWIKEKNQPPIIYDGNPYEIWK